MNVKIIKSAEDYEAAMTRLSALMSLDPEPNSSEESELELLALVMRDFERQTVPTLKADPIESLFRMDQISRSFMSDVNSWQPLRRAAGVIE